LAPNVPLPPGAEPPVRFAVGDLDGDHDLDLYAVSRDQDRLYLDDGSGAFVESSLPADADWSTDVELADADGDGDLDAWIANRGSASSERLMLNDGHAGFSASTWTTSADASAAIAVGDLDGDGDLDVITGNTNASNKVYLNDGASHWIETPSSWPSVYGAYSIALADGDGDGDLDVFLSDGWLRYFPNDGAAVFTQAPPFVFTSLPGVERVAAGDIDGDGDSDVVGSIAGGIYVEKSFGAYFQLAPGALSSSSGTSLELADVDADGDLDALVTSPLAVFLNDGDGVFTDAIPGVPLVTYAASSATSDLDGDGDADVLVARSGRPLLLTNLARQLAWRTPPAIGRTLELVLRGPAGEPFVLVASHGQVYLPFGSAGVLKIDRSQLALRRYGHLDAHGRAVVTQDVAGDPSLAGTSLYWQALIANPRRLTNLEITTFADL
jgi:hypothetical protein